MRSLNEKNIEKKTQRELIINYLFILHSFLLEKNA